jgi:hypothetical protein
MKQWIQPEITPVTLEPEEDVLSYCYSLTSTPSNTGHKCHNNQCFSGA